MRKTVASAILIVGFILLSGWNCHAGPGIYSVNGEYFIEGARSCAYVNNYQMFGENFVLPNSGGTTRTGHYQGHLYLNGDGIGSLEVKFVQYYHQSIYPGQIPIAAFNETCAVSYEELPNRLVLTMSDCYATTTAGSGIGTTWTLDPISLTFFASFNGDVLLLSNTSGGAAGQPAIERTWQPDYPNNVIERVCSRSLSAVRINARR
jgi:hypothetical protein